MSHRIVVSAEFIRPGRVGGAEQMVYAVVDGIGQCLASDDHLMVVGDSRPETPTPIEYFPPPKPMRTRFFQEAATIRRLGASATSWLFPNYHTPRSKHECRIVTVIHDLQYRHFPHNFSLRKRGWLSYALLATLRRADRVVVPSMFVKDDVVRSFGSRYDAKVHVIPNPIAWGAFDGPTSQPSRRPYVLTVAAHYDHKNLSTLVRAFAQVRARRPDIALVLVGQFANRLIGVRTGQDIRTLVAELELESSVSTTGYVTADQLHTWYRGAELFVFPSLFEGFGAPPVEALGMGLPVLTTNRTSIPEVTQGEAVYLEDPYDPRSMAEHILEMLEHRSRYCPTEEVAERLRHDYSPARIGQQYYDILTGS